MFRSDPWRYVDRTLRKRKKDILEALTVVESYDDFRRFQGEALAVTRMIELEDELLEIERKRQERAEQEETSTPSEVEEEWR